MVSITEVTPGSRAEQAGIMAGDLLESVNGSEITDVLDYRFYLASNIVRLSCLRDGQRYTATIHKRLYDDIGLCFATPLMDKKHCCANRCVFCFIDQNPEGMRESIYFKDDDSRLSFLHGNYVTLTNLHDKDIDRLIKMHLSPINVSVHTTNPDLRVKMMGNRRAGEVLSYLKRLADAGIALCGQIVLCRGLNDGDELTRTMHDLAALYPALSSVSVIPVGLTRYREGLYPLTPFSAEDSRAVIAQVDRFGAQCKAYYGSRIFFCADEFYLNAGLPLPDEDYYEGYSQIENGVGMLTSLKEDFALALSDPDFAVTYPVTFERRRVTVVTGQAASATVTELMAELCGKVPGLEIQVRTLTNRFFGESITVAGLLTGQDMAAQLACEPGEDPETALGELLVIPSNTLRAEGDLFLCGMSPQELSDRLGVPLTTTGRTVEEQINAMLGIRPPLWRPGGGQ